MLGIVKEDLCRVSNTMILLSLSASTIDARRSFGGISTHEAKGESGYKGGRKGKGEKNER